MNEKIVSKEILTARLNRDRWDGRSDKGNPAQEY